MVIVQYNAEAVEAMAAPIADWHREAGKLAYATYVEAAVTSVWQSSEPWSRVGELYGRLSSLFRFVPAEVLMLSIEAFLDYRDVSDDSHRSVTQIWSDITARASQLHPDQGRV